ncbi:MAG: ABC transporter [Pirellulaceae bacterium]|nr:MAG: ABC transporter [Pirellulaceae bacterium]
MKTDLAWRNLLYARGRTLAATAGVALVATLVFMQIGFFRALERSATLIYQALEFDLCLRSPDYLRLSDPGSFPYQRLYQARSAAGVRSAAALWVGLRLWRSPQDGQKRPILVMGIEPQRSVFRHPDLARSVSRLQLPQQVLLDRLTRSEYGPVNGRSFTEQDVGLAGRYEISGKPIEVVGLYELGAGFSANGSVVVSAGGFERLSERVGRGTVQLGLLQVEAGYAPEQVARQLRSSLPPDVVVLTRQQVLDDERDLWVRRTSYGLVFQLGIAVAVSVGAAVVYQILSGDIAALLPEYATMMAMGYTYKQLVVVILRQGAWLALFGYLPATAVSYGLYELTRYGAQVPMRFAVQDATLVALLTLTMCLISAGFASLRLYRADPASLY